MSGGSYEYAYRTVQDLAEQIKDRHTGVAATDADVLAVRFAKHLGAIADVAKAIEWWDSCDTGPETAQRALALFFDSLGMGNPEDIADAGRWRWVAAMGRKEEA